MNAVAGVPILVEVTMGQQKGRRFTLPGHGQMLIGRGEDCDIVISDATVSRLHARLRWQDRMIWVEDLESSSGTRLNGQPVSTPRSLSSGDRIQLGAAQLRYEGPDPESASATPMTQTLTAARFDVGRQSAGTLNNVGRDQYATYVAHIQTQRDSFLHEVAATRTKARWLVWLGLVVVIAGFGGFLWVFAGYFEVFGEIFSAIAGLISGQGTPRPEDLPDFSRIWKDGLGRTIGGVNVFLLSMAIATAGQVMLLVGIVVHIVATSRRKRVDRALTVAAPWTYSG